AYAKRQQFRGTTEAERAAWLRQMLAHNLADALRGFGRDKRDLGRERSIEDALQESSARLEAWLAAEQSAPSEQAVRHEQAVRLADALARLPEQYREAVVMHYCQALPLAEVGQRLGRSTAAVGGLLKRGLKQLRAELGEGNDA